MLLKILAPLVPYLAVGIGLLVFRNAWLAIVSYHVLIASVFVVSKPRVRFRPLFTRLKLPWFIIGVFIGASGGAILWLLWPLLSVPAGIAGYLQDIGLAHAVWPYFIAYYVLVNPFFEEYFWRGLLGSDSRLPVLNDFLFAGYHLLVLAGKIDVVWLVVAFFVLSGGAWYWRQITRTTGGLLASVSSHLAADVSVILAIYFLTMR